MNDEKQIQGGIPSHISTTPEHIGVQHRSDRARDTYNASLLFIDKHKFAFSIFTVIITLQWIINMLTLNIPCNM